MWGDWRDAYVHGTHIIWPPDDVRAIVNPLRQRYVSSSAASGSGFDIAFGYIGAGSRSFRTGRHTR